MRYSLAPGETSFTKMQGGQYSSLEKGAGNRERWLSTQSSPVGSATLQRLGAETGQAAVLLWRAIHQTYPPTETMLGTVLTVTAALYGKGLCHRAMEK